MKGHDILATSFAVDSYAKPTRMDVASKDSNTNLPALNDVDSQKTSTKLEANRENSESSLSRDELQKKDVEEALTLVQRFLEGNKRGVNFSIDDTTDKTVIKVTDKETKELVRQLPSEEMLRIAEKIKELEQELTNKVGILIDSKA